MPKARIRNNTAPFPPEVLKILGELCDEVWASIAANVGDDPDEIETAQIRLAAIVLELAKDGQLAPLEITQTASRLMSGQMSKRKGRTRLATDGRSKHGGPRQPPARRANVSLN